MADRFSRFNEERDFQVKMLHELHVSETYWMNVHFGEPCFVQFGIVCSSRRAGAASMTLERSNRPSLAVTSSRPVELSVSPSSVPHTFLRISSEYPDGR